MLLSAFKYACINAKIRGMYGKLLEKEAYDEMISSQSVMGVASFLKNNTAYGSLLSSINENLIHRGELETILKTSLFDDFAKIFRYLRGNQQVFLKAAFLRYEIEDLKVILRILSSHNKNQIAADSLNFLKRYSELDYEALEKSRTIPEFVDNLKESVYYNVLSPFVYSSHPGTLFDMEMALDLHFFTVIFRLKDKLLTGQDKKNISESFGTETDILNIMWIYRCKKFFDIPKEVILNKAIPHWYRLNRRQLLSLAGSRNLEEFKSVLSTTRYNDVFNPSDEHLWPYSYTDFIYTLNKKSLLANSFNFKTVMAYIHLKEIDIRNIITVIEGIRYRMPAEKIRTFVTGHYNAG